MSTSMKNEEEKFSLFQIVILVLSIYVLISLAVSAFTKLSPEVEKLLNYIDFGICIIFLVVFVVRFREAEDKLKFMKWGWIDLLSSIPAIDYFRAGRVLRLIRLLRLIRAFRSTKAILNHVFRRKAHGMFTKKSRCVGVNIRIESLQ